MLELFMGLGLFTGLLAGVLVVIFLGSLVRGFVLSKLWLWFMVPLGLPGLGIAQAIGISVLVEMLTHQADMRKTKPEEQLSVKMKVFLSVAVPLITLLFGYLVHLFM